jgi:DNA-binding NarL/FixJ family response regulator
LHLALAASRPDDGLAGRLASASGRASSRGAREQAVQLAAHALRLTPTAAAARAERVLALASYLYTAGELRRLTDLLIAELDALPLGAARARALLLLSEGADTRTLEDHDRYVQRALSEAGEAPGLRARALATRAANACATAIAHLDEAEAWALEAVAAAAQDPDGDERFAVYSLAWTRAMTGHPIDELCERSGSLADAPVAEWAERIAGQRLVWRGELARARPELEGLRALADSRGEVQSYTLMRLHVCELELRAGAWDTGAALLDEWGESSERELLFRPMYERCRALVAAGRGEGAEARRWATRAVARAQAAGCRWDELEAQRALAMAALLEHQPARAADYLRPVWRHTVDEGVDEPGVFPVAPELVEALAELGELDEATAVTARLRDLAERQAHPWALVSAERCAAVVRLAEAGHHEDPAAALARAADDYDELGLRFDAARSLLSLGRAQRRFRQWGSARRALDRAQSAFAAIGSHGWAEQAGSELARVGARKPRASDDLTPAQRRAAELAASGLSNKEIARTLVVTVHTVEVHLSRAYAKLGVTSRGQLARRLSA